MHIHLDLVGGIAGDMFAAAMLDAYPELEESLLAAISALELEQPVITQVSKASDMGLNGKCFSVNLAESPTHAHHHEHKPKNTHDHGHKHADSHSHDHSHHDHSGGHSHHSWRFIRQFLLDSNLEEEVKDNAIGIFQLLAVAEAKVHNQTVDNVQFHEVGAWDCIVDIISAAWLITHSGVSTWSVSDLPWGGGTVKCAHGNIPVPAPATLNLLLGFRFIDDGNLGERITPTGAAILSWLSPSQQVSTGILKGVGYGFGNRKLKDRANVVRISILESAENNSDNEKITEQIAVIQCDIDDMTNEMLAIARENIRSELGVLEITESVSHGKKNRMINTLTVLAKPEQTQNVINKILNQTSTIGVRYWHCGRVCLKRLEHHITDLNNQYRVKSVRRPDLSVSSKVEADHIENMGNNYQDRIKLKRTIEQQAEVQFNENIRED